MSENTDSKTQQTQHTKKKKQMLVRFGRMNTLGLFDHNEAHIPKSDMRVVVKTPKGLQLGTTVGAVSCYKDGRYKGDAKQINSYFQDSGIDLTCERVGKFIRYATHDDILESEHLQKIAKGKVTTCQKIVNEKKLSMKIVDAEHIFGGERIVFYFMADGRVDFRELVKTLSHEFQTRIEMRQIGARDEARILGDVESCGQECCCKRFLKFLKPVNMRMAKMQKATLDPAKISGYCGRLKCCLRYEDKTYIELKKRLPARNSRFLTPSGPARVLNTQIITQMVILETDTSERIAVHVDDLRAIGSDADVSVDNKDQDGTQDKDKTGKIDRNDTGKSEKSQRRPRPQKRARTSPKREPQKTVSDSKPDDANTEKSNSDQSSDKPAKPRSNRRPKQNRRSRSRRARGRNQPGKDKQNNNVENQSKPSDKSSANNQNKQGDS